jgi:hypothetical protein
VGRLGGVDYPGGEAEAENIRTKLNKYTHAYILTYSM